ncbi:INTEGRAL MEMBRANE PROTEIN (Rhomboid family) [Halanaerobium saccharolyticum subsp. saccharolyticum DSM 6643]|uniref:UPF0182 protein HSACCH_01355 n=1 Tax=Halanaerobium saccharolyticum subsp. saccharolyticum DSM 6643 TaxID=1293054 RepID=M5EEI0_9FIRM|nr:UPF0182 family protein [Halanaerobium saccharolyticum]CCU79463.1 INTEGRAL MEMBRANE PROTEIN (Rhomboid family) [Halanaerobium saccharolyticum subsp. saccharolyticum DSM 6643]
MSKTIKFFLSVFAIAAILLIIFISTGANIYTDWLWFKELNFEKTFTIMFLSNFILRLVVGAFFTTLIYLNLHFTKKPIISHIKIRSDNRVENLFGEERNQIFEWLNKKRLNLIYLISSLIFGFLFSSVSSESWKMVLKFLNKTDFNNVDPIFNNNISFYVFSLPFYKFLREMGMVVVVISLILVGAVYIILTGIHSVSEISSKLSSRAKKHISVLIFVFLLFKAWDYRLKMYNILFSPTGVVFGAGYTDVNANLLGYRILFFTVIFVALAVLYSLFRNNYKPLVWGIGAWVILSIVFTGVYPAFIQQYRVEPNEINLEEEYIENNIQMTLNAYKLNDVKTKDFELSEDELSYEELMEYETVVNNIRLWDHRPLQDTYNQLQALRQYYTFEDIDIDRYQLGDDYTQVMLGARELDQNSLAQQAQTWVNKTLKYTHGLGVTMSPTGKVRDNGQPEFLIQDIPPKSNNQNINLDNSSIYYGEKTNNYVIVNTNETEFHYPMGSENVFTEYEGTGGVGLPNLFRKSLFALRFNTMKILLSDDINDQSQIMYERNIHQRVRKAAPFLKYDSDPYIVNAEGRLFWIYDAYTTTSSYPYSQPYNNRDNYVRNSIKVVVDAYNGTLDYYIVDESDPIAETYSKIFDDLFKSFDQMPDSIKKHIRYPQDLFKIQSQIYSNYHMEDPVVYYNREDVWSIPQENYQGSTIPVEPYYIMNQLPGEEEAEFILMTPFTPSNRNNMIAWMAARNDGENYGELFAYRFPKDQLVYGPSQIESRIDQESEISQLLTLWSQQGSNVIRGNLLVIPVNNSVLYVEPIFLQADSGGIPELRRVILSYKNKIIMRENLEEALKAMFEEGAGLAVPEEDVKELQEETGVAVEDTGLDAEGQTDQQRQDQQVDDESDLDLMSASSQELINEATSLYKQAEEALQNGDFATYGETINQLGEVLNQLSGTGE